jgi:hypothetical protein
MTKRELDEARMRPSGVRRLSGMLSVGLGTLLVVGAFMGTFTGTWVSDGPDFVCEAEAADSTCQSACSSTAGTCIKKCVVDQKPCLDKCNVDPDSNPKRLKPQDEACTKACFRKARPCEDICQARRAECARRCP